MLMAHMTSLTRDKARLLTAGAGVNATPAAQRNWTQRVCGFSEVDSIKLPVGRVHWAGAI